MKAGRATERNPPECERSPARHRLTAVSASTSNMATVQIIIIPNTYCVYRNVLIVILIKLNVVIKFMSTT